MFVTTTARHRSETIVPFSLPREPRRSTVPSKNATDLRGSVKREVPASVSSSASIPLRLLDLEEGNDDRKEREAAHSEWMRR
ncbi:hypothetical protein SESBI_02204 [Sesbania bispinosa]|nr:hypothetical protein SESBI_02204 [Sesbania bispinosa]